MTSAATMLVYFDDLGDIKGITPATVEYLSKDFSSAAFALETVEPFLLGKANLADSRVVSTNKKGIKSYKLEKKYNKVYYTRTLDNYLTKIETLSLDQTLILIKNNTTSRAISIELSKNFTLEFDDDEAESVLSEFVNRENSEIYITRKNDPYILLYTLSFSPSQLVREGVIWFNYAADCSNSSAYTKRIISGYSYQERK